MSAAAQARPASGLDVLPPDTAVNGLPVVTLAVAPKELAERGGLQWTEVDSELGAARIAVIRIGDGPRFALTSYDDAPSTAVTIAADGIASEEDVDALLEALGVPHREVLDRTAVRAIKGKSAAARPRSATRHRVDSQPAGSVGRATQRRSPPAMKTIARGKAAQVNFRTQSGVTRILRLVADRPGITARELGQALNISERSIRRAMARIEADGAVRKQGSGWHALKRSTRSAQQSS